VPILTNTRHEKFAQELATGKSATEAYVSAGYRPSRKNASRLRAKDDISARVVELQGSAARSSQITIQSICCELDAANAVARERGQAAAMVSASALRAKLAGLMTERIEIADAHGFDRAETVEDVADAIARSEGIELTPEERIAFVKILDEWHGAMKHFLASCVAKPVPQPMMSEVQPSGSTLSANG
jgi:hypothetical protein